MNKMTEKILIVEDEIALSEAYEMILRKAGYEVAVAADGGEAMKKAAQFKPQLILLDLRMPRVSGIEFLQQYKRPKDEAYVKIIVFSNLDSQQEIEEAYSLGADRYILKAWASPSELLKLVADSLNDEE
jgi:DNA-binding response OmpR family regulator